MTINKAQGPTFERVGVLLLPNFVFGHGQLYVAFLKEAKFPKPVCGVA